MIVVAWGTLNNNINEQDWNITEICLIEICRACKVQEVSRISSLATKNIKLLFEEEKKLNFLMFKLTWYNIQYSLIK